MTTLAIMKARITREIRRSNITTQIAEAIETAIAAYEHERFAFNETRAFTFSTVASQEFYTSADDADIGLIIKFDYVYCLIGDQPYELQPMRPDELERLSHNGTQTGQPRAYCYYADAIRLYPVPPAVYTIRVGCVKKVAAPASDAEANNPWMTPAERLIRSRAKLELAMHVTHDKETAKTMADGTAEAMDQLKSRTNTLTPQGGGIVEPVAF